MNHRCLLAIACLLPILSFSQGSEERIFYSYFGSNRGGEQQVRFKVSGEMVSVSSKIQLVTPYYRPIQQQFTLHWDSTGIDYHFIGKDYPWMQEQEDSVQLMSLPFTDSFPSVTVTSIASLCAITNFWEKRGRPERLFTRGSNAIVVSSRENVFVGGRRLRLYSIGGLSWGRALLWIDVQTGWPFAAISPLLAVTVMHIEKGADEALVPIWDAYIEETLSAYKAAYDAEEKNSGALHKRIIFKHIKYWDGVSEIVKGPVNIVVQNGIIKQISSKKIQKENGDFVVDGKGKYLFPGLRDMHAHIKQADWIPAYLSTGITTFRDLGNDTLVLNGLIKARNASTFLWPNFLKWGIFDGKDPRRRFPQVLDTLGARQLMNYYKARGYNGFKVWNNLSKEVFEFICRHAPSYGLPVSGHIPSAVTLLDAIKSGINEINHLSTISNYLWNRQSEYDTVLKLLRDRHVIIDPTIVVTEVQMRPRSAPVTKMEPSLEKSNWTIKKLIGSFGMDDSISHHGKSYMEFQMKLLKDLSHLPLTLLAGSDQGVPGFTLLREIELYVASGLSHQQALQIAMQSRPYQPLITEGKTAELVLYAHNPLERISAIRQPLFTLSGGYLYNCATLRRLAGLL